jgi:hypothetical protein
VVLPASAATGGLEISGAVVRTADGTPALALRFVNRGGGGDALDGLQLQLNKNAVGLTLASPLALPHALAPGGPHADALLHLAPPPAGAPPHLAPPHAPHALQAAVKSPRSPPPGVFYFAVPLLAEALFTPAGADVDASALASAWRALPDQPPKSSPSALVRDAADATARLGAAHVHVRHARPLPDGGLTLYAGATLPPGPTPVVVEITCRPGVPGARIAAKSASSDAAALTVDAVERLLV